MLNAALSAVASTNVDDATLGAVAIAMAGNGSLSATEFGAAIRSGISVPGVADASVVLVDTLPDSEAGKTALLRKVYEALDGEFLRRSAGALSKATGLTEDAVIALVSENSDFRVSTGTGEGNRTFVSKRT